MKRPLLALAILTAASAAAAAHAAGAPSTKLSSPAPASSSAPSPAPAPAPILDAGAPASINGCVESIPSGGQRPLLVDTFPERGFSGYAATLSVAVEHGKGETVLPNGLSLQGRLYAAPFYGESSMTLYRQDLLAKAGLAMPPQPTWADIAALAARLDDPRAGVHGVCLRGKPGWGDNMALVSTMVNAFGGQWFDMAWHPQIESRAWQEAVSFYVDLLRKSGPRDAAANSFNENLRLFEEGHCAIWVDATVAAALVTDAKHSAVADRVGFAQAPTARTSKGANWLWAWALAIPADSTRKEQAQRFVRWATSKAYVELVGREVGWSQVPTGTRISTYRNAAFIGQARWAMAEAGAISLANPSDSTLPRSPYVGVQFAAIPEFQAIGQATGESVAAALAGMQSVDAALHEAQQAADREMRRGRYYK